jgi:hypothetical protein
MAQQLEAGKSRVVTCVLVAMLSCVVLNTGVSSRAALAASSNGEDIERICGKLDRLAESVNRLAVEAARSSEAGGNLRLRVELLEERSEELQKGMERLRLWVAAASAETGCDDGLR